MAAAAIAAGTAAPSPPLAAGPPGPISRLGAPAADTTFTRVAGPLTSLDPDELSLPSTCPAITSLQFLTWSPAAAGGQHTIPEAEVQGLCILACTFNLADGRVLQALRSANLLEHELGLARCSAVFHELHDARIFEASYHSDLEFITAVQDSSLINTAVLQFDPSWLSPLDPFDVVATPAVPARAASRGVAAVAAVPAAPASPGPASLKFLHLATWASLLSEGTRLLQGQESRVLARAVVLLSHRRRNDTRHDTSSDIQSVANTLATYARSWAGLGVSPSPSQLARQLPSYFVSCMSIMPADLAGSCGTAVACEAELRDGQILLRGRETEAASVVWARIHCNLRRFPVIDQFSGKLGSCGETKDLMERLMIGMQVPPGTPLVRTWELVRDLERKGKWQVVRDLFAGGSTPSQVVEELLDSHTTTAGAAAVLDSGVASSSSAMGATAFSGAGSMEQREFERAITSPNFIAAYETMKDAGGTAVLDAAATSGSVLMLRFLFSAPSWMRPRHTAFDLLGKCLADRASYLAYCSAVSATDGEVPKRFSTYRLSDFQSELFWSCRWSEMDMVNADLSSPYQGGFLALRYLENGTKYDRVIKADFFTVESSLLGIRDWFGRLLLGVGFSPSPGEGFSWTDVIDRQIDLVRYFNGLPAADKMEWQVWANENFTIHALERAQTLFKAKLITSRPADEVVSAFLPDGSAFFSNITAKLEDAQPIAVVRRAFPSYFSSATVALPGTTPSTSRAAVPELIDAGRGRGGGSSQSISTGKQKLSEKMDSPGSKAGLSKMLSDGTKFLASKVCDINAVAASLKVKVDDYCWPVLFSNKSGASALALCPCPDQHGGLKSKFHQPPKGFDKAKLTKRYFTAASAEQLRAAGWRNIKRAKT